MTTAEEVDAALRVLLDELDPDEERKRVWVGVVTKMLNAAEDVRNRQKPSAEFQTQVSDMKRR